jgi:hypothetical protein
VRPYRHTRQSGYPEVFDLSAFRVALAIASLPGMTRGLFDGLQLQDTSSVQVCENISRAKTQRPPSSEKKEFDHKERIEGKKFFYVNFAINNSLRRLGTVLCELSVLAIRGAVAHRSERWRVRRIHGDFSLVV